MSTKYPGGLISKTAPVPTGPYANSEAPGVWTLEQQAYWVEQGNWPTAGNVDPSAFIENLFSTYLYTGNSSTQTITNGIDLAGEGGLVWIKNRQTSIGVPIGHILTDTARGVTKFLRSQSTSAQETSASSITAFNSSGFSFGSDTNINYSGDTYASWTFRKQPKFFDVVTYTGNGGTLSVSHALASKPGCIIIKKTSGTGDWLVCTRKSDGNIYAMYLNTTAGQFYDGTEGSLWTSSAVSINWINSNVAGGFNDSGATYVMYVLAHNAGGFGLTGTDNVISCGSYTGVGSTQQDITLGYEPQWVMIKRTDTTNSWIMVDNMRGFFQTADNALEANSSNAEAAGVSMSGAMQPTATGFHLYNGNSAVNASGGTYIYIAIRRGPMKVPTDGTSVFTTAFYRDASAVSNNVNYYSGFVTDSIIFANRTGGNHSTRNRLTGANYLVTNLTDAETTLSGEFFQSNVGAGIATTGSFSSDLLYWMFRRAPGFFDEVCYTGTGVDLTVNHNLGVVPEWVIIKNRSRAGTNWSGAYFANASEYYDVRLNQDIGRSLITMGPLGPTLISNSATTFGVYGGSTLVNYSGDTYVAYLFATCAGVSKVGTYTGTGTTQAINCGFTTGARFVLIKRTDSTGDWYVWDSARGIVSGNDPYLLLNSTAAETTGTDYVDTYSAGFEISSTAPSAINASGGTFIFLAIA